MKYPKAIQNLIQQLSGLPSVGPKTAERYAFHLLGKTEEQLQSLAATISVLKQQVMTCSTCRSISETNPCPICKDSNRQSQYLCVVENSQDLAAIEATKQYQGRYFVLGGLINTIEGIGPEQLNVVQLAKIVKAGAVKEIILALNFTLEGETTALYLSKIFKNHIKLTRLAKGLPAGSDLEYADPTTLTSALEHRNELK